MVPIWIPHNLKRFYLRVDMLNDNTLPGQPFVVFLLPLSQVVLFARLFRYPAVWMMLRYPQIPKIRL
jgi:hypothetical protein